MDNIKKEKDLVLSWKASGVYDRFKNSGMSEVEIEEWARKVIQRTSYNLKSIKKVNRE